MRGVNEEMLERGLMAFVSGTPSSVAAGLAGVDRLTFLIALIDRRIPMTDEAPEDMLDNLLHAADEFGNDRLRKAVTSVQMRRVGALHQRPGQL